MRYRALTGGMGYVCVYVILTQIQSIVRQYDKTGSYSAKCGAGKGGYVGIFSYICGANGMIRINGL